MHPLFAALITLITLVHAVGLIIPFHPLLILLIGVIDVVGLIILVRLNAFIALIVAAMLVSLLSPGAWTEKIPRVAGEFGIVVRHIGIVIALAAIIGKCLMDSGAADRIVRSFLKVLGEKRASWALMGSGFVLSIPVFFDTVFYLLIPLARSLWRRTHKNYLLYATAIVAGAAITHTLVPPTPGPLFMASQLKVSLGLMIMMGVLIGFPTAALALLVCRVVDKRLDIPMRPYSGQPEPEPLDDGQLPPLWISLTPVILPVILISANTVAKARGASEWVTGVTGVLGDPNLALLLATAIAMFVLARNRGLSLQKLSQTVETALMSGGVIILITAGGGAFGAMLRAAGIKEWITAMIGEGGEGIGLVMLLSAAVVASVMKFAQGSGTVSMITTVSIFGAMGVSSETLGFHPVYLALAIGSGSLVGDWMNNSGFWIFARMTVLTEVETLKSWTILTASLGVIGLIFTVLLSQLMPLI